MRQDETGVLARAMDEMVGRLEHRIRADRELLANISHELRTPLQRVSLALELRSDERASLGDIRQELSLAADDVSELNRLIEDILATSRLERQAEEGGFVLRKPIAAESRLGPGKAVERFCFSGRR